ncbi:RsmB/NOP family class I SAM-dependent RNA methyltransferase [Chitinibacteraceae bacterium HSL-7]
MSALPAAFAERLAAIVPAEKMAAVVASFSAEKDVAFRVNTLKAQVADVVAELESAGLTLARVDWQPLSFVVPAAQKRALTETAAFSDGRIYIQNLASQLAPLMLAPQPGETVLDLAAAPGGKTCQMAAMMANDGQLSAVEPVRDRFFRLKANLDHQGVTMARTFMKDGRAVGTLVPGRFDRVLLDAPCSSEARFDLNDPDSMSHWSPAKVKEVASKQKRLLKSALLAAKPGGLVLYSTCSFAPEENEAIVAAALKDFGDAVTLEPLALPLDEARWMPGLTAWQKKTWPAELSLTRRVLPDGLIDGFYLALLRKQN